MQLHDADLYDRWVAITEGKVSDPSQAIREQFDSEYIISDLNHKVFLQAAAKDEQIVLRYEDDNAVVFQVLP